MPPRFRRLTSRSRRRLANWPPTRSSTIDDLEGLEQHLTVLEEKMIAAARAQQSEEQALESRRELDRQLRPYRGKMTADQLSMLEKQYLERHLLEQSKLAALESVLYAVRERKLSAFSLQSSALDARRVVS